MLRNNEQLLSPHAGAAGAGAGADGASATGADAESGKVHQSGGFNRRNVKGDFGAITNVLQKYADSFENNAAKSQSYHINELLNAKERLPEDKQSNAKERLPEDKQSVPVVTYDTTDSLLAPGAKCTILPLINEIGGSSKKCGDDPVDGGKVTKRYENFVDGSGGLVALKEKHPLVTKLSDFFDFTYYEDVFGKTGVRPDSCETNSANLVNAYKKYVDDHETGSAGEIINKEQVEFYPYSQLNVEQDRAILDGFTYIIKT